MAASATDDPADDPTRKRILEAPLAGAVLRFGTPLALAMVLQVLFNLVDQYLIAKLPAAVSDPSLDALGICDMVAALGTILSYGVSTGTATLLAQHKGAGDETAATRVAWGSIGIVLALGLAFGALGVVSADVIVHDLLGAKGVVRALGVSYLRVIVGGSVTAFMMFQVTSLLRALGDSRTPLLTIAFGNALNLFLAVLFVYGPGEAPAVFSWGPPIARALGVPRMEVVGAAWATLLARAVAIALPLWILRRKLRVAERGATLVPPPDTLRAIVRIAWPTSAQFVVRVGAVLFVIALVHHFYTTPTNSDAGTAYALCLRLETMALFVSMGWGGCAQTFVGMCLGAGDAPRASRAAWVTAAYNVATMLLLSAAFLRAGGAALGVFTQSAPVLARATEYLALVAPSYALFGAAIVLGNALLGAGASRLALRVDAALVLGVQLPLMVAVVLFARAPAPDLWRAVAAVNALGAVVYVFLFRATHLWMRWREAA
jgi:putative MATE family efflux protein